MTAAEASHRGRNVRVAWSVERGAWSVERGAWSVERGTVRERKLSGPARFTWRGRSTRYA